MGSEPYRERIRRELRQIWVDPPAFCRPGASPVTDLLHWEVVIDGPDGSPYAGGTFPVDVDFGRTTYPLRPPKITFRTKVYHPNINSEGEMTLDIFRYENWSAAMTVRKLLIVSVLREPTLDGHPTNDEASEVYETDLELYEQMAMAWTWEYSSTPIVSHYPPVEKDERRRLDWDGPSRYRFQPLGGECLLPYSLCQTIPVALALTFLGLSMDLVEDSSATRMVPNWH
ncbi:hypothetical protein C2845_PM12G25450 [Panicum miliaceum]|uniref:UBC core domain-containing protein n=1 Tax=Panicum miliaceum TaxID=4540 RepID=A0A3L6QGK0_PANMI|nr:hypothetical protein C2845_PM12G25450 [Panicum miliaceum]